MEELTLLQRAMRIVEQHAPALFDVHTQRGRDFIHAMQELLKEAENGQDKANANING